MRRCIVHPYVVETEDDDAWSGQLTVRDVSAGLWCRACRDEHPPRPVDDD